MCAHGCATCPLRASYFGNIPSPCAAGSRNDLEVQALNYNYRHGFRADGFLASSSYAYHGLVTTNDQFISPRFKGDKLSPGTLDDKIDVFEDQVKGWTLTHAYFLTDRTNPAGAHNAGFAILMLCSAYFETIESCYRGRARKRNSKMFFRSGFLKVFPDLPAKAQRVVKGTLSDEVNKLVDELYTEVRCGLYHGMATKTRVLIIRNHMPVTFTLHNYSLSAIVIDPWAFLEAVGNHFVSFLKEVRDPANTSLRSSFESFFDDQRAAPPAALPPGFLTGARSTY
jgi:hypothetical protein